MRGSTRWLPAVVALAFVLAVLTVSAQNRTNPREAPNDADAARAPSSRQAVPRSRTATPLVPASAPDPVRVAAATREAIRVWDAHVTDMERTRELRLKEVQADTLLGDRRHERLEQYYRDVPVFGGDIVRESYRGSTLTIYGTLYSGISIDTTPQLTTGQAIAVYERETAAAVGPGLRPELVILPKDDRTFVLAYRMAEFTGDALPVLFVNAATGNVELRYDNLQTEAASWLGAGVFGDKKKISGWYEGGRYQARDRMRPPAIDTFDLAGNLSRAKDILVGASASATSDIASSTQKDWTDGAAVDAHSYLGWTYDYLFKRFGRRGLDDHDTPMRAIVHPARPEDTPYLKGNDYATFLVNAFWCDGCGQDGLSYMVFGDGNRANYYDGASGRHFEPLAGGLDVVAHELTHGLTSHSSGLIYRNESGALNEAFSDIVGTSVEFYFQPAGSGVMKADYLLGEDVARAMRPGSTSALRSLADPAAYGNPDHYSKRYIGTSDNGGVHTNSGIAGHAFYLAIEGGTNRTSGLTVQGVGAANREQIERVFYRAFVYYLTSSATFSAARAATIRAAQELYGPGSAADRAVTQAWTAVGVS